MLAGTTTAQSSAPCVGPQSEWTNCFGEAAYPTPTSKYSGEWKNGKRHGQGTAIATGGTKYIGTFNTDKVDGVGTLYAPDGKVMKSGVFRMGDYIGTVEAVNAAADDSRKRIANTQDAEQERKRLADEKEAVAQALRDKAAAAAKRAQEEKLLAEEKRKLWLQSTEGKNWTNQQIAQAKREEEARKKLAAEENARVAKEFPFYAVISCGTGQGNMGILACFSYEYGSLEVRNGSDYGLYKIAQIASGVIPNANEQNEGLVINLRNSFEINARNGDSAAIIMEIKIIRRSSGATVFQKQVDQFGSIRIKN